VREVSTKKRLLRIRKESLQYMQTSTDLEEGHIYTRHELREKYEIVAASLNNGIFRPKGHSSIWLFVTERKSADRTQYVDLLKGDTLYWDGQSSGRSDQLIIEHEQRGLEIIVVPGNWTRKEEAVR